MSKELIAELEKIKRLKRTDHEIARNAPLLSNLDKDEIHEIDIDDAVQRAKLSANEKIARRFIEKGVD